MWLTFLKSIRERERKTSWNPPQYRNDGENGGRWISWFRHGFYCDLSFNLRMMIGWISKVEMSNLIIFDELKEKLILRQLEILMWSDCDEFHWNFYHEQKFKVSNFVSRKISHFFKKYSLLITKCCCHNFRSYKLLDFQNLFH